MSVLNTPHENQQFFVKAHYIADKLTQQWSGKGTLRYIFESIRKSVLKNMNLLNISTTHEKRQFAVKNVLYCIDKITQY